MMEPTYQEIKSKDIPIWKEHGIRVKIIAGKFQEVHLCSYKEISLNQQVSSFLSYQVLLKHVWGLHS